MFVRLLSVLLGTVVGRCSFLADPHVVFSCCILVVLGRFGLLLWLFVSWWFCEQSFQGFVYGLVAEWWVSRGPSSGSSP